MRHLRHMKSLEVQHHDRRPEHELAAAPNPCRYIEPRYHQDVFLFARPFTDFAIIISWN